MTARKREVNCMEEHDVYGWVWMDEIDADAEVIDPRWNGTRKASGLLRSRCVGWHYAQEAGGDEFFAGRPRSHW